MGTQDREEKRGTALIADVVNFYGQEPRSLEEIAAALDDLFTASEQIVAEHGGMVVKWLGDGLLAVFWGDGTELRAIEAAVALQESFEGFMQDHAFRDSGLTVSIATGPMIAGTFGRGPAAHYEVFGEPVNCTATVMPGAGGEITLCAATYEIVQSRVEVEPLADHDYYGRLYALRGLKHTG